MTAPAWKDCRRAVHVRSFLMQMLHFVQHDNVGVQRFIMSLLTLWRRGWDSNPRCRCQHTCSPGTPIRPLSHLSALVRLRRSGTLSYHEALGATRERHRSGCDVSMRTSSIRFERGHPGQPCQEPLARFWKIRWRRDEPVRA